MSKAANAGELRTPVYFIRIDRAVDSEGYPVEKKVNVFGDGVPVYARWVNAHGTEVFASMQLELREPATLTVRYSPKITAQLLIYREADPAPYEVVSMDNVEQRSVWLEIKVQRRVTAR